jgi:hypothetical protein
VAGGGSASTTADSSRSVEGAWSVTSTSKTVTGAGSALKAGTGGSTWTGASGSLLSTSNTVSGSGCGRGAGEVSWTTPCASLGSSIGSALCTGATSRPPVRFARRRRRSLSIYANGMVERELLAKQRDPYSSLGSERSCESLARDLSKGVIQQAIAAPKRAHVPSPLLHLSPVRDRRRLRGTLDCLLATVTDCPAIWTDRAGRNAPDRRIRDRSMATKCSADQRCLCGYRTARRRAGRAMFHVKHRALVGSRG